MARIAGVNIPTQKRVEIALTYIHGIGRTKAREICGKCNVPPERRVQDLTEQETIQTTMMVIAAVVIFGIFMWLIDMLLLWAVQLLTGQGG